MIVLIEQIDKIYLNENTIKPTNDFLMQVNQWYHENSEVQTEIKEEFCSSTKLALTLIKN